MEKSVPSKSMSQVKKNEISLNLVKEIEIARSFSQTVQLHQFEPINAFASYKATLKGEVTNEEINKISQELQAKAIEDVETKINDYYQSKVQPF